MSIIANFMEADASRTASQLLRDHPDSDSAKKLAFEIIDEARKANKPKSTKQQTIVR